MIIVLLNVYLVLLFILVKLKISDSAWAGKSLRPSYYYCSGGYFGRKKSLAPTERMN